MKRPEAGVGALVVLGIAGLASLVGLGVYWERKSRAQEAQAAETARRHRAAQQQALQEAATKAKKLQRRADEHGRAASEQAMRDALASCYGHIARLDRQLQRCRHDHVLRGKLQGQRKVQSAHAHELERRLAT